ncbi:hypothetical protein SDC9_184253 [bioreactor metagenome]|uniref:Uncharacterized protein n=1 Tax=bioreactor metagenome TaxID=1076179 RepID=A0A645HEE8_9ZZZZ
MPRQRIDEALYPVFHSGIVTRGDDAVQIGLQCADVPGNRHAVVVQDDHQTPAAAMGVVQRFE